MGDELAYSFGHDASDLRAVDAFIKSKLGSMCFVSTMPEHKDDMIGIGIYTDEVIVDSTMERPRVRFVSHDDIFRAYYRDGNLGKMMVFPTLSEIDKKVSSYFESSVNRSEITLLRSMGERIVNIPTIRNQMNPMFEIITFMSKNKDKIAKKSNFGTWSAEKLSKYLDFLQSLDIVIVEGNDILPGKKMNFDVESSKLPEMVMANMVENHSKYMVAKLNLNSLQPYTRLSNANCMTSFMGDTILKWDSGKCQFYMKKIYGTKIEDVKITSQASTLTSVGIFREESISGNNLYYCHEDVYKNYKRSIKQSVLV